MSSQDELLYIGFNQDASFCTLATERLGPSGPVSGFRVLQTQPLTYSLLRSKPHLAFHGSFGIVELLEKSNIVALVGGGKSPRFPSNKLVVWDDRLTRVVGEVSFRSEIKSVRLRKDVVAVTLETNIFVYSLHDLQLKDHFNTAPNPKGLCSLSTESDELVVACPGMLKGKVMVKRAEGQRARDIDAHQTSLAAIALNSWGNLLATASDKGTVVRVFQTADGKMLHELRRGIDRAEVYWLAFSASGEWLACSSDKGTVHVYRVRHGEEIRISALESVKKVLPRYFDNQRSYAKFKIKGARNIFGFVGETPDLVVITADGIYNEVSFINGGKCTAKNVVNLLELDIIR
jgi:WD repeat-containing protein 45